MHLVRKLLSGLLLPLPLAIEILLLGLFLLWFTKRQRTGKLVVTFGVILLGAAGHYDAASSVLRPLERAYPPLTVDASTPRTWIVVLGGGHIADPALPPTSQIGGASLARIVEAVRIQHQMPGVRLLLSGGTSGDPKSDAQVMAEVARAIGVPDEAIVLEEASLDTEEQAETIEAIVGTEPFVLVTSASHMRRAMALFEKRGMKPVAAPAGHLAQDRQETGRDAFLPGFRGIRNGETAVHEYIGLLWAKIRGRA
ncbi:MAG: envelope biogenesis factor ElyC [Planctomycetes bacterium]|nr:envelope biogenesis factor ElyC [Planctomycetota bacterium]